MHVSRNAEGGTRTDSLGTFAERGNELSGHVDIQFEDNVVTPLRNLNKCSDAVGHDGGVVISKQVSVLRSTLHHSNLSYENVFYLSMPTNPSLSITRLPASDA